MKSIIILISALLAFASNGHAAKVIFSDLFIFRVNNSVYSLDRLHTYEKFLEDLNCFYPDSIVVKNYSGLLKTPKDYFVPAIYKKKKDSREFLETTFSFLGLVKMIRYASSQSVSVSSELPKALILSAKKNKCVLRGFEDKGLKDEMANLVLLEVFLRSRFMSKQDNGLSSKQITSILKNISSLEDSVKNQIDHELLEN
ncbi:MAG: hypothetical protein KC478_08995 [Bacteriovoracaceae bacterium]|nr:hypothetical protein [Bacteriovoracaceae bacterium]